MVATKLNEEWITLLEDGKGMVTPLYNFSIKKCHTGLSDV